MQTISIDPGVTGSIISFRGNEVESITLMPTIGNPKTKAGKLLDAPKLVEHFGWLSCKEYRIFIEKPFAMPGRCRGLWEFAEGYGILKGIISTYKLSYIEVGPQTWRSYWKIKEKDPKKRKAKSVLKVQQLMHINFEPYPKEFRSGIADAILIGLYGQKQYG